MSRDKRRFLASGGAISYRTAVLADSPVGYYKLDDPSGTVAADTSGHGIDAAYRNAPTLNQPPLINLGASIVVAAGSSQDVNVPANAAWNTGSNQLTVEAWVKTTQSGASTPMIAASDTGSSPNRVFQFRLSTTNKLEAIILTGVDVAFSAQSAATINDGARHHLVATYDGANLQCYVDGVASGAATPVTGTLETGTTAWQIGSRTALTYFTGTIDEVARYTTALSSARVAAHYAAGIA